MTATEMGLLADRDFLLTFGGEGRLRIHQKLEISVELATREALLTPTHVRQASRL